MSPQSGLALVLALVFLFVSTLIAVASMNSNVTEERMSRNTLNREQAFQTAEVALTIGETYTEENADDIITAVFSGATGAEGSQTYDGDSCKGGFCIPVKRSETLSDTVAPVEHWKNSAIWTDSGTHITISGDVQAELNAVAAAKYIIEFMRYVNSGGNDDTCDVAPRNGMYDVGEGTRDWTVWPFCTYDQKEFRVTAVGYAGNNSESRVMLQSIYIVP